MLKSAIRTAWQGSLVIGALLSVPAFLSAAPVTIQNPSFEFPVCDPTFGLTLNGTPIESWPAVGSEYEKGQWDIGAFPYGCWNVPAPHGNQVAYAAYLFNDQGISQTLAVNVEPNTLYTLTGWVGSVQDPNNPAGPSQYAVPQTISLIGQGDSGDQVLNSTTFIPVTGHFEKFTLTFNSTGSPHVGLPLKISLVASADQVAWDDIALDASPAPTAHAGDFDSDGDVDGADFVAWQTNFPKATGATLAQGDADADGDVDGADFVVWQTNFPFTPGGGAAPVPEPSTLLMVFGAALAFAAKRVARR